MKTSKVLAFISFLAGVIFIINGSMGSKTFYYETNLEGLAVKSFVLIPSILAMILGALALILIIKAREVTPLFILLSLLGIIMGGLLFLPHWAKSLTALRQSDLSGVIPSMEMYYYDEGKYPEIKVNNGYIENESIGGYSMPKNAVKYERILDQMFIKSIPFKGISNSNNREKYCIYAKLSEWNDEFFAVSQQGAKTLHREPTSLDDCY